MSPPPSPPVEVSIPAVQPRRARHRIIESSSESSDDTRRFGSLSSAAKVPDPDDVPALESSSQCSEDVESKSDSDDLLSIPSVRQWAIRGDAKIFPQHYPTEDVPGLDSSRGSGEDKSSDDPVSVNADPIALATDKEVETMVALPSTENAAVTLADHPFGFYDVEIPSLKKHGNDEVAFNVDHYDLPLEVQQKMDALKNTRRMLIPILICQAMFTFIATMILWLMHFDEAVAVPCI